jgi:hypothetical protein
MSPEERAALESAKDIVAIANALLVAKSFDRRRAAVSMLTLMEVMLADDVAGRVALAQLMCECAADLLNGVPIEQLNDTVNVRWWN